MSRINAETPDWGPLERLFKLYGVPSHVLGQWMYMGSYGAIRTYKHVWTREYVNLDCSRAYKYIPSEQLPSDPVERWLGRGDTGHYRLIPKMDALPMIHLRSTHPLWKQLPNRCAWSLHLQTPLSRTKVLCCINTPNWP